jgi:hypothetical protein
VKLPPRTLTPAEAARVVLGLVVQPLVTAAAGFFGFFLLIRNWTDARWQFPGSPTEAAMSVAAGTAFLSVAVTLLGVVPTVVWIVRRRRLTFTHALLFGLAFGNLPMVLGTLFFDGNWNLLRTHAFGSLTGISGAAAFWLISIRGRDFSRDPAPVARSLQPARGQ